MIGGEARLSRRAALVAALGGLVAGCTVEGGGEFADVGRGIDDVTLASSAGADVRWRDLIGPPRAVFFGFTHCPVICPVTIYELTAAAERIGSAARELAIQFVTVDPERDTPERMRQYFSGFGPSVTGYTSAPEQLERIKASFEISATRVALENGGYTIDHTATVFLLNRAGRVQDVIAYGAEQDVIDQRLRALLDV